MFRFPRGALSRTLKEMLPASPASWLRFGGCGRSDHINAKTSAPH